MAVIGPGDEGGGGGGGGGGSSVVYQVIPNVYYATINPDGTLGPWLTGTSLPDTLGKSQVIVTSSKIYLLGGINETAGYTPVIYSASFSGGVNDYSPYYSNTGVPGLFGLPDYTAQDTSSKVYHYIKY
jgi:hypothetical protein